MESLKKNTDFRKCYAEGRSFANRHLVIYVCGNELGKNRIGISVSKKVGNSVVRHRTTRLIREVCRLHGHRFRTGNDIVFIARVRAKGIKYSEMEGSLLHLAKKAGIMENRSGAMENRPGSAEGRSGNRLLSIVLEK